MKITMLGVGSSFTQALVTDIMLIPEIEGGTMALVDIDAERLKLSVQLVKKIAEMAGKKWEIIGSTERKEVIADSDYVINFIDSHFSFPLKKYYIEILAWV